MTEMNELLAHRALMGSAADADVCWWYMGSTMVHPDGQPPIATLHSETIMICRTETIAPDAYRIRWLEIGCFRDPVTGEPAERWANPVTGETVAAPSSFEEGPSAYTVVARDGGLSIELTQAHATVRGVEAALSVEGGRLRLTQTERKVRGFPLPDGSMPGPDSGAVTETTTVLTVFADAQAVLSGRVEPSECLGLYSFELPILPAWMGFSSSGRTLVSGVMRKTSLDSRLNAIARDRLKSTFPAYFTGDDLTPPWG